MRHGVHISPQTQNNNPRMITFKNLFCIRIRITLIAINEKNLNSIDEIKSTLYPTKK